MPRSLIICGGNTCRSPTLELLLRHLAERLGLLDEVFESAGHGDFAGGKYPCRYPANLRS